MQIRALHVNALGRRFWGRRPGTLHALLPEPVDADACLAEAGFSAFADSDDDWDRDFDALVQRVVETLAAQFGAGVVVAPRPPRQGTWWSRLRRLGGRGAEDELNPLGLDPAAALRLAAEDDSALGFARVEFGGAAQGEPKAFSFASDGHPILWLWSAQSVDVEAIAGAYPGRELAIDWSSLMPASLMLASELPRVGLQRGDAASWDDGEHRLSFMAGLGVSPPEVYLPSETAWLARAPSWAAARRPEIVADFEHAGVRVVERDDAWVGGE